MNQEVNFDYDVFQDSVILSTLEDLNLQHLLNRLSHFNQSQIWPCDFYPMLWKFTTDQRTLFGPALQYRKSLWQRHSTPTTATTAAATAADNSTAATTTTNHVLVKLEHDLTVKPASWRTTQLLFILTRTNLPGSWKNWTNWSKRRNPSGLAQNSAGVQH